MGEPYNGPMSEARLAEIRELWLDEDAYYAVRELLKEVDYQRSENRTLFAALDREIVRNGDLEAKVHEFEELYEKWGDPRGEVED